MSIGSDTHDRVVSMSAICSMLYSSILMTIKGMNSSEP